jgi:twitching motility protein PilT
MAEASNPNQLPPNLSDEWKPPAPPLMQRPRPMVPPTHEPTRIDPNAMPSHFPSAGMPMERTAIDPMARGPQMPGNVNTGINIPGRPLSPGIAAAPPQTPMPPGGIAFPGQQTSSMSRMTGMPRQTTSAPGYVTLRQLVQEAFDNGYSDIHLGVGEIPRFRDRGQMIVTNHPITTTETYYSWLRESLPESQIRQFEETMELDTAVQYEGLVRCRVNCFVSLLGPALVMRLIPIKILSLEQLRAPEVLKSICQEHKGLVLVTGPTGSGKSTTLAAMVDYINSNFPKHIISIEDPVEFVHQSKKSMLRQREVGIHTLEFANALKASLREDPDVILIGEMRDRETVDTAIKAAQTGHLVFGTLHTNSAVKTIERLLGIYRPEEQEPMRMQLAETLVACIAQTLVRTTDSKRCAAHEIMRNTDAIRDYIKRGAVDEIEELIMADSYEGMCTMNQALFSLYQEGRITEEVCLDAAPRQNEMAQWLRGRI